MRKISIRSILSQAGISLVEMSIGLALVGGVTLVGVKIMEKTNTGKKNVITQRDVTAIRSLILSALQHEVSFAKTISNFSNRDTFACLRMEGGGDCSTAKGEFRVYRATTIDPATGNVKVNEIPFVSLSSQPSQGFTSDGVICNSFNGKPGQGSDSCPYKYVASWTAICPKIEKVQGKLSVENKCHNPLINIHVKLLFNAAHPTKFKRPGSNSDIKIVLAQVASDKNQLCGLVGNGYFDEATNKCVVLKSGPDSCDNFCGVGSNSIVQGFYDDGSLKCICDPVPDMKCSSNGVVLGMNDNGELICGSSLIAGLTYSGALNNTPQTYLKFLQDKLAEASVQTNQARTLEKQAQDALDVAKKAEETAEKEAKAAEKAVDEAKKVAGGNPTSDQLNALDAAIEDFNQKVNALNLARATYQKAEQDLQNAIQAEAAAKDAVKQQLAKM